MSSRKPLTVSTSGTIDELPATDDLSLGNAAIRHTSVITSQVYSLPATGGTIALTSDIAPAPIDGGSASSVYLASQSIDGGAANRTATRTFDGGGA